jgi:uncharacterized protein YggE
MDGPLRRFGIPIATWLAGAGLVLLSVVPAAAQAPASAAGPPTVSVVGEGEATGAPDVAYVSVGVQTQSSTAADATGENSRLMTAVLSALRARGVASADLQTSGLVVAPQFNRDRPNEVVGYQATNNVTVTVNQVERAGELLDAALAAGANRIGGLRFGIRDVSALREQALGQAAASARVRADAIAAGLGLRVVGVSSATEEAVNLPQPRAVMAAAPAPGPAAAPPPVEAGELHVTARVRVVVLVE